ncbi:selenophosphate synthase [Geoalkalibacter ferrihydriticus]|uniref:Selenophosphate synthase n=1 Tax=Geoalkalibacter ferrihydriticus TaxID=392333 RepID=A0A1G9R9S7_9BACT|nr:selenophosphate synthase [Geoalkalibacter ferrihydriticus]
MQSVDFFTPVVDDPFVYGQIAAANALSDIYAMGGRPITALNLIGFPLCQLGVETLIAVLQGGADKVAEAGAVIAGGHSVEDDEPKYGLSVTGLVDPRKMVTTVGARAGDLLFLTKPLGTGILTTALKGEILSEADLSEAITGMATLNRRAAEIMLEVGVNACTDITGFGLLGHALELAMASQVCVILQGDALPAYPRALEMAAMGLIPEGSYRNRSHYLPQVLDAARISTPILDLLADPQTSGGLLISVAADKSAALRDKLLSAGCAAFLIGRIAADPSGRLQVD